VLFALGLFCQIAVAASAFCFQSNLSRPCTGIAAVFRVGSFCHLVDHVIGELPAMDDASRTRDPPLACADFAMTRFREAESAVLVAAPRRC
jgi:hypothetical protein